jgi:hypothetical protein
MWCSSPQFRAIQDMVFHDKQFWLKARVIRDPLSTYSPSPYPCICQSSSLGVRECHNNNFLATKMFSFLCNIYPTCNLVIPEVCNLGGCVLNNIYNSLMCNCKCTEAPQVLMSCRNPCRLYIHLAFTYSIGPSSIV